MPRSRFSGANAVFLGLLKDLRVAARLTQVDLAAKLGRPQSYVSKFETGERRLDFVETVQLCEALGVGVEEFAAMFTRRLRRRRNRAAT